MALSTATVYLDLRLYLPDLVVVQVIVIIFVLFLMRLLGELWALLHWLRLL